tara:strand:+ start:1131 stop:4187 length:3057 start_codon:yes stop_codon:yes gene_type:complete
VISKDYLLQKMNIPQEVSALLGQPKNGKYKCFRASAHANNDANPSLTMNEKGYWKCHACAIRGDFFQLYMDVRGIDSKRFGEVILEFARKYNVDAKPVRIGTTNQRKKIGKRKAKKLLLMPRRDIQNPKYGGFVLDWLLEHYGINMSTINDYHLGWCSSQKRLYMPVPLNELWTSDKELADLVNIRRHDVMKYHVTWGLHDETGSQVLDETGSPVTSRTRPVDVTRTRGEWHFGDWKPVWNKRGGKVIGIRGFNSVYLYPMGSLNRDGEIWIVGGELKALLLLQSGINAISFTCGETSYAKDLLQLFSGRNVRIVYDVDQTGQTGSLTIGRALANVGANVKVGTIPSEGLPANGDITDFMRINNWEIACLSRIEWTEVTPERNLQPVAITSSSPPPVYVPLGFSSLNDGEYLGKYISVPAIISGKGTTPFAVPKGIKATCRVGQNNQQNKCAHCVLATTGFQTPSYPDFVTLDGETVVDLTGLPKTQLEARINQLLGIPKRCKEPKIKIDHSTVQRMVLVPTVDIKTDEEDEYRHQEVYLITDGKQKVRENEEYLVNGKLIGDPRNHAFTLAALETHPIEGNVFSYRYTNAEHAALHEALWTNCSNTQAVVKRLVGDLRSNVLHKFGVDTMITIELLSWFMPFTFKIGQYVCHKVCPEVLIIGDTRVGKSTTARDLAVHLGAGRYVDCGSNATFVGLVGGNTELGSHRVFTWGVLPTSHRGHVTMDEANKLHLSIWGGLTNLKSSGIAERVTNAGARKTRSHIRMLTLCNPRGNRPLGAYDTPLDAAIEVVGTPQDLARVDLLYVARALEDHSILNQFHQSDIEHCYTRDVARYHLRWAWSLKEDTISFDSPDHVLARASDLLNDIQGVRLVAPSEAKFKIGRLAIAIASVVYSIDRDNHGVIVRNEHVDMAYNLLKSLYTLYLKNAGVKTGVLPQTIKVLFDGTRNPKMLRILSTSQTWTNQDFSEIFGDKAGDFKYLAQLEHSLMSRRRGYFIPVEGFSDLIRDYVNQRIKSDQAS